MTSTIRAIREDQSVWHDELYVKTIRSDLAPISKAGDKSALSANAAWVVAAGVPVVLTSALGVFALHWENRLLAFAATTLFGLVLLAVLFRVFVARAGLGVSGTDRRSQAHPFDARHIAETIAASNPDAVLFFSDTGIIRYTNPSARELFFDGNSPEGQNFLRLLADAPGALREALLGDSDRLFSVDVEGKSETYHVTRRTFMIEDELHTLLIVRYLTREVSRREVEVLKQVIRVISHEVNNSLAPVTSLVHSARLIAKNPEHAPKLERVFDTIEERAAHLKGFLDGYVSLARLPAPRARDVEWAPFLRQIAELYPDISIPSPPGISGFFDPIQIEQVVINLIKNAREAGSNTDQIELALSTEPGGATELRVLDRGRGFSDEALKSAILPLYTTKERGSGMGLALSREIVEAHGGALSITNRTGGGACIALRLPGKRQLESGLGGRSRLTLTRG